MKQIATACALLVVFSFYGCKKDQTIPTSSINANPFFDSAVKFLKSNLLQNEFDKLDITNKNILAYRHQNLGIQFFEKGNSDKKFLLLKNDNSNYSGNWIDMSGLTKNAAHSNSGIIIVSSLDKSSITKLVVDSNDVIEMDKANKNISTSTITYFNKGKYLSQTENASSIDIAVSIPPKIIIYERNYGVDYLSWYWFMDQFSSSSSSSSSAASGYNTYFSGSGAGGVPGGYPPGNDNRVALAATVMSPDSPIDDLSKELKCFTNNSTSTYKISVNVNQPYPGSRDVINATSSYPVGHTFLTLEQDNTNGGVVLSNIGFYPRNSVKNESETDESIFGDDSFTPYDVSLTLIVTGSEMIKVINALEAQQALKYDLNNFNCTNSPMEALKSININLPSTKSDEPFFEGNDPGDLGEDIRNLNLNIFRTQNGNRKVIRDVANKNIFYPKGKSGTCP